MLPGVDAASWQGPPGTWAGEAGNIAWAAVKLTELSSSGHYTDPVAAADWAFLKASGKLRLAYLFAHPAMAVAPTVSLFKTTLDSLSLDDGDMIAIDLETTDGLRPSAVAAWTAAVAGILERDLGRKTIIYTYLAFADAGNCAGLGSWPLWISDPDAAPGVPRVPAPWTSWALHQYDISGAIDRDVSTYATQAAMSAALGKPAAAPPPPVPAPTPEDDPMYLNPAPGSHVVLPPWASTDGKPGGPYSHLALILTGDTGTQLTVTIHRGAEAFPHVYNLATGMPVSGDPVNGWDGVTMLTVARTDTSATAAASAVLTRW